METDYFVDLQHRDEYSVKDALGNTALIMDTLKERGQTHYAVANYGELSGWINQYFVCLDNKITPMLGFECYVNNYRAVNADSENIGDIRVNCLVEGKEKKVVDMDVTERSLVTIDYSLLLYARTMEGYYNIIKIHNDAQLNGVWTKPRTNDNVLKECGKGVVCLLPTPYSEVSGLIYNGEVEEALVKLNFYRSVFEEVFLCVTLVEDDDFVEINNGIIKFAAKHNVKVIPVLNSHYINEEDERVYEVLRKTKKMRSKINYDVDLCNGLYYRNRSEVVDLYKRRFRNDVFTEDEFKKAFGNLNNLVESFGVLPVDTTPKTPHFEDADKKIREFAFKGLNDIGKGGNKVYVDRLEYELDNIVRAGFTDYFYLLYDVFKWCKDNNVGVGPGRGCFTAENDVLMGDLVKKQICDVNVGETVVSGTGAIRNVKNVLKYFVNEELVVLFLSNGKTICCTKDHKLRSVFDDKLEIWKAADDVNVGGNLKHIFGDNKFDVVSVVGKAYRMHNGYVYDLEVEHDHSYVIEEVVVHNSAAGSLVLNCLGITQVDPLEYNLLFERFLDASRLDEIISGGGKVSGCFVGDTYVKVDGGHKFIKDIVIGDMVYCHDGSLKKVLHVWKYGKHKVRKIFYGNWQFECTDWHKLFVKADGWSGLKFARDLIVGDRLIESDDVSHEVVGLGEYREVDEVYDLKVDGESNYRICGKLC